MISGGGSDPKDIEIRKLKIVLLKQEVESRCIEFAAARNTALANLNHKDKEIASLKVEILRLKESALWSAVHGAN